MDVVSRGVLGYKYIEMYTLFEIIIMNESTTDRVFSNHKLSTSVLETGGKQNVIFCYGYRGSNIEPNRFFVRASR